MISNTFQIIIRYFKNILKVFIPFCIFVYKVLLINELIYSMSKYTQFNYLKISSIRNHQP